MNFWGFSTIIGATGLFLAILGFSLVVTTSNMFWVVFNITACLLVPFGFWEEKQESKKLERC